MNWGNNSSHADAALVHCTEERTERIRALDVPKITNCHELWLMTERLSSQIQPKAGDFCHFRLLGPIWAMLTLNSNASHVHFVEKQCDQCLRGKIIMKCILVYIF